MIARSSLIGVVFLVVLSLGAPLPAWAARTDILVLDNRDRITGEILSLQRGKLNFKTDNIGTLSVEWKHVAQLRSTNLFTVETARGASYFGSLAETSENQIEILDGDVTVATLALDAVVNIYRVKEGFWGRLDGSLDVGYSYTQQNGSTQYNLSTNVNERTETRQISIDFSSIFSTQEDSANTTRNDLTARLYRRFEGKWFYLGVASVTQNNGLDLDLRTLLGGGIGRELYHSNSALFAVLGGLDYNRELYTFNVDPVNSLEVITGVEFSAFTFDGLTRQLTSRLVVLPNLTDTGRVRLQLDVNLRQNIVGDLYWNLNLFETYDSRPPQPAAANNDFGITTSLGWTF